MTARRRTYLRITAALAILGALASCGTVRFYSQAVRGQSQIWWRSKPIPEVLANSKTTPALHTKLQLVQELRSFAKDQLHLPADKSFHHYADLGRDYVVWVVYAAPEFSVEAKAWWYPIVGSLKYRGFFDEKSAKQTAESLKRQGYDVLVGGVEAYSTLGWFADPVLNTFLRRDEADLAELIFHELTHIKLFIPGDTDFNEALATAVGQEGTRRWLASHGKSAMLSEYSNGLSKDYEIIHLLQRKQDELRKLYASNRHLPEADQRTAKQAAMAHLKDEYQTIRRRWQGDSRYDRFFKLPMNNARLSSLSTYHDLVPAFERLLANCDGDLDVFFQKVSSYKDMTMEKRRAELKQATTSARR